MTVRVALETAPKRSFASALDWPGWSRGGRTADEALEALRSYAPRYAAVARRARVAFDASAPIRIVERLPGGSGTEFGVPGTAAAAEDQPLAGADLRRLLALLRASWRTLDEIAAASTGIELRRGPRGGGRDLAKILEHVRDAEVAYLAKLGSRAPAAADEDPDRPMDLVRAAFADALDAVARGRPVAHPNKARSFWSPRYAVRRSAWHVLDHAWEIEDRSSPT